MALHQSFFFISCSGFLVFGRKVVAPRRLHVSDVYARSLGVVSYEEEADENDSVTTHPDSVLVLTPDPEEHHNNHHYYPR